MKKNNYGTCDKCKSENVLIEDSICEKCTVEELNEAMNE